MLTWTDNDAQLNRTHTLMEFQGNTLKKKKFAIISEKMKREYLEPAFQMHFIWYSWNNEALNVGICYL